MMPTVMPWSLDHSSMASAIPAGASAALITLCRNVQLSRSTRGRRRLTAFATPSDTALTPSFTAVYGHDDDDDASSRSSAPAVSEACSSSPMPTGHGPSAEPSAVLPAPERMPATPARTSPRVLPRAQRGGCTGRRCCGRRPHCSARPCCRCVAPPPPLRRPLTPAGAAQRAIAASPELAMARLDGRRRRSAGAITLSLSARARARALSCLPARERPPAAGPRCSPPRLAASDRDQQPRIGRCGPAAAPLTHCPLPTHECTRARARARSPLSPTRGSRSPLPPSLSRAHRRLPRHGGRAPSAPRTRSDP
mmetsp:Transcript_5058/g.20137  ORF Transcript_5058/g.20137 Transcript_5058/m.20137 type:complete len:309 (-) Transcript_5058:44-970(-)